VRAVQRLEPFTSISEGTLLGIEEIGIPGRSTSPVVRGMVNVRPGQARRSVRAQQPSYSFAEVHIQYVLAEGNGPQARTFHLHASPARSTSR